MTPELRMIDVTDWMTIVLLFALLVFTLGKYLFQARFANFIALPFNNKYLAMYGKKGKLLNWFHILLTIFQLFNLALFIYLGRDILIENPNNQNFLFFWWIFGLLGAFETIKILLQLFKGYVFNTYGLVTELIYNKLSYFNHGSIVLFIANILLIYLLKDSKLVIYTAFLLFLLINGIGLVSLLKNNQKLILTHSFYFILYLCTLEIAPLVILGSYLKG